MATLILYEDHQDKIFSSINVLSALSIVCGILVLSVKFPQSSSIFVTKSWLEPDVCCQTVFGGVPNVLLNHRSWSHGYDLTYCA